MNRHLKIAGTFLGIHAFVNLQAQKTCMKIQYCSDLHLEFQTNQIFNSRNPIKAESEILILAGDIVPLHEKYLKHPFFDFVSDNFEMVFWVPGNHEFYYKDIADYSCNFDLQIRDNLRLVSNTISEYGDVKFVFSTLWSRIQAINEKVIEKSVSDFECITYNGQKFTASIFNRLHDQCVSFLEQSLSIVCPKTVVITHHLPSAACNAPGYNKSRINEAFCVNMDQFILDHPVDYWIYGHSHFNQQALQIGNTRLLTNQLGYVHLGEHLSYQPNASIDL